jgi:formimidoylglutamate deiminase
LKTVPTLFANAALLDDGWRENVRLTIADGEIRHIQESAVADPDDERVDTILPGMPNGHSHAFQRAMAGRAERRHPSGDDFWAWRLTMYSLAERLNPEQLLAIATLAYMEMLEAGYTSVAEFHYLHNKRGGKPQVPAHLLAEVHSEAASMAGIRLTLIPTLYMANGFDGAALTEAQLRFTNTTESFLKLVDGIRSRETAHTTGLGIHSLRAVPADALRNVVNHANSEMPNAPVHIHIAEQQREVDECILSTGQRPVEWLLNHHDIDERWCLIHATHATAEELQGIAERRATIILCPTTEANLGDGVFNYSNFVPNGGQIGIGSDSQISINPWQELQLLEYSQRLTQRARYIAASDESPNTGRALFDAALRGGRVAVGKACDDLAEGKAADLIALNMSDPRLAGLACDELIDALIFANPRNPIDAVMVGGEWKTWSGQHTKHELIVSNFRDKLRMFE